MESKNVDTFRRPLTVRLQLSITASGSLLMWRRKKIKEKGKGKSQNYNFCAGSWQQPPTSLWQITNKTKTSCSDNSVSRHLSAEPAAIWTFWTVPSGSRGGVGGVEGWRGWFREVSCGDERWWEGWCVWRVYMHVCVCLCVGGGGSWARLLIPQVWLQHGLRINCHVRAGQLKMLLGL